MNKNCGHLILPFLLILDSSCIHVQTDEVQTVRQGSDSNLMTVDPGPVRAADPVFNPVYTNVRLDYQKYLITKTKLLPGEETKGLLFFNLGTSALLSDSHINYE